MTLIFNKILEIAETRSCKISSSWVQWFMNYRVSRETRERKT